MQYANHAWYSNDLGFNRNLCNWYQNSHQWQSQFDDTRLPKLSYRIYFRQVILSFLCLASRPSFCQNPAVWDSKDRTSILHEVVFFVLSSRCVGWSMSPFIVRADPTFITYIQLSSASRFGRFVRPTWWWLKRPKHVVDDNWIVVFKNLCSRWQ